MKEALAPLLTRQIVINLLTIIIPVLLLVQILHRKHRTMEINTLFRMCILNIILCLAYVGSCAYLLHVDQINKDPAFVIDLIFNILIGAIPFLLVVHWLLFVEYTLHQSKDIVWRRYPVVMIPFAVGVLVTVFSMIVPVTDTTPRVIYDMVYIFYLLGKWIWAFYVIASYVILYREKKRKRIPQYIRLTPTVLCIAGGLILSLVTSYTLDSVGYALGLMFADYFMSSPMKRRPFIRSKDISEEVDLVLILSVFLRL